MRGVFYTVTMNILEKFYPDNDINSTYEINFEELAGLGYRGIIFDVDNTLVPHGAPADEKSIALFKRLKGLGMKTMLLSNNKEPRVKAFAEQANTPYIYKANKPGAAGYIRAMKEMGTNKDNTVFIGDQLFTDVWGAKRAGIITYLVKPIHPKEEIQIVLKRYLEKIVLYFYRKKKRQEEENAN